MPTKLIIIRHGMTEWSEAKRYCGRNDVPLSNAGKAQAAELRGLLAQEKIDSVYASGLKRAYEFAAIAFEGFPVTVMDGLNEMDFGIFEGLAYGEIMQRYPAVYSKWIDDPAGTDIPEGESMKDFKKRVEGAFEKIARQSEYKTSAVVAHAGSIKMMISDILKIEDIWKARLEWGRIAAIVSKEGKAGKWVKLPLF